MITSYKIIALAERGMLVEFTDADAVITRQLNLLPPYDLEGNLLTGDALKSHIVGSAPAKEMAAQVKAKADSASYDANILEHAYKSYHKPLPWQYYKIRDARTVYSLWPGLPRPATSHHALEDCRRQIDLLQATLTHLNIKELA